MKRFIYKIIFFALPILTVVFLVNYFGDAARLFDNNFEKQMVKILVNGQYITNINNYDERLFQKELISNKETKPNIVIIGSSRAMLINSDYFPNNKLVNNSVSGASLEDIVGIYQMYKENKKLPQKIIIGIDPWTFNQNNNQKRWMSIANFYNRFQKHSNKEENSFFKYKELFSFSYFQNSIKMVPSLLKGNIQPKATREKYNVSPTKLKDGSLVYGNSFRNASPNQIENKMNSYISGNSVYSLGDFNVISNSIWNEFEKLIADMKKNNIKVEFFLAPYAPIVYDKIKHHYPKVLETEVRINNFAKSSDIMLYGSFDPVKLGMDSNYFYDGMHCKESGIKTILKSK
jgi:hypothetical protein